ncbi:MAG: hypothetical protein B7733_16155 [Myxococcales bacterium FL481]|nr:MAG: hypothetical protein B7733_16155 [Myxococcales bacterium FL481]
MPSSTSSSSHGVPPSGQPNGPSPLPRGLMDEDGRLAAPVQLGEIVEAAPPRLSTLGNVGGALAVLTLCVVATYLVPALEFARPWNAADPLPFWNLTGRYVESDQLGQAGTEVAALDALTRDALDAASQEHVARPTPGVASTIGPYTPHPDDAKEVTQSLELFGDDRLDSFFASLARSEAGQPGAITRVVHWGDSAIGVDGITSAIRHRMQQRFGDAGHGFHLMAPPNTSYRHQGVKFKHNDRWGKCFIIRKCRRDGHYGLGGVTFRSLGGAESSFAPAPKRSLGKVSRFEVWYAAHPGGGKLRLRVDRGDKVVLDTHADQLEDRWHAIDVEDGMHQLSVRAAGSGRVRVYGVTMERDVPGVVWDGLALVGAFTNRMTQFDADHLRAQLEHRRPQLAVLTFGGNDMVRSSMKMSQYADEFRQVIRHVRTARPEMACVVMSPLDHGKRQGRRIITMPVVPKMIEAQRQVAKEEGCGFFDTFSAMGGDGSAGRWHKKRPRLVSGDLSHVTFKGQLVLGELFYRALMQAYVEYRRR